MNSEILIRSFKNTTKCASIGELKTALIEKYQGMHVTIKTLSPSGAYKNTFVTVNSVGDIKNTYTNEPINLENIG